MKQLYQTPLPFTCFSGLRQAFYRKLLIAATLFFCLASVHAQTDEATVDHALLALQDVTVISKTVTYSPYLLEYQLSVKQPVDHTNPASGYFYQQVHLIHRGFSKPMVMETEGYDGQKGGNEIEKMLGCNDIDVEFRYFNKSKPDSLKWQYLTFEQATADLHHINQVFHTLYHSKWISTGISRGGSTALIYKYFFPKDVDAAVPYVAPMPNDIEDRRIYAFLDTAGGVETASKIKNVQLFLLQHEKEILDKIPAWETKLHYTTLGSTGAAFEYAVLEYPFSFWQISNYTPKDIPTNNDLNTYINHLSGTFSDSEIATFSDEWGVTPFLPHAYMTYQTGYYKYNLAPFKDYLHYLTGANPTAAFLPDSIPRKAYDPTFEKKINAWLAVNGSHIIYIYGGTDTWSACKVEFNNGVDAKRFMVPNANHFNARVKNMPLPMQQQFAAALEQMTGLKADLTALK
jgi:hypothetical protein